ncbi:hypothetical protein BRADI_4g42646v3 [Brachypodium distachyon]|uniref:KIB1-4 beta-propeller domain-containing protein n=1 Tax=Brachypodium distachyon TaxID=15368 RepID=A0A0Q3HFN1_BRADI|nr:hypothetical protein BRADI_4g42646v3 [Brachypodium distachyon]
MATEAISSWSPWSDGLPPELTGLALRRLPSLADRVRFGAVCRHWRLAAQQQQQAPTLPPALPWISIFPRQVFQSFPDGEVHNLGRSSQPIIQRAACCGLSENWLLFVNPAGSCVGANNFFLKNPLSGATIPLPKNYRFGYGFYFGPLSIRKFIVCSDDDGLTVAMARGHYHGSLTACCRPGMSVWSIAANPGYEDIAFHHGNIYGVTRKGDLYAHNISEDSGTRETVVSYSKQVIMSSDTPAKKLFLVVSRGNLLLVKCYDRIVASAFEVFKADLEMSRWSEVSGLGDQVLFVSQMCSKAVSASSHGNYLCGNRIYFMDDETWSASNRHHHPKASVCGMYDLRNNICHRILTLQCSYFTPTWFFPHK